MKLKNPLFVKLIAAIALGALIGLFSPGCAIRTLNSFSAVFSQFIKFVVPFIIVGLVTPAIADAGRTAGRLLLLTTSVAYVSTLVSGFLAFIASKTVFPSVLGVGLAENVVVSKFPAYFTFAIPPVMSVETALVVSFMFGLGMVSTGSKALLAVFEEMRDVVSLTIERVVVPLLPFYIFSVVAHLAASKRLQIIGGASLKIMVLAVLVSIAVLLLQYLVAGLVARRNPLKALWTMLPAYFTGLGCCSSAATIPVTLKQSKLNGVSDETANLVVPLCANIHLSGSMANMVVYAAGLVVLSGETISVAAFIEYILMVSVVAVASPGVPGGVVLACASIAEVALGFSPERYAIMIAIYMALDGMGTACNLTGDGAIAIIVDHFKKGKCQKGALNGA